MRRIWTVASREIRALFDLPTGYVLLVVFLAINAFLFFRQAYLSNTASLRPMLDLLPWEFLFFVPAVTMRSLAEDLRGGQIEVVLAQPVSELEVLLGKFLGSVLFLWTALLLTFAIPLGLSAGADIPWGTVIGQYVGAALLAAGLAGIGVWASSLTKSQITAFIVAAGLMFVLVLVGLDPLLVGLPPSLGAIAARIGVLSHFESLGRGVIDLRDVIYFVSLAGVFLALAYGALLGRKLAPGAGARRLKLGVGMLAASLIVVNLLGSYIGGRLDLTPGNAYTLSPATGRIVRDLNDIVTVKVFASKELPAEVALMKRDVDDLLRDLRSAGHGQVRILERDPSDDEAARREAESLGIQPVQFNVIGQAELQVKQGYLGLAVQHGGQTESIPFVQRTDDLEYRLASTIRQLSRDKKPAIGFVADAQGPGVAFTEMQEQLRRSYDVRDIDLADSTQPGPDVVALVLAGTPDSLTPDQLRRLEAFINRGGSALVLSGGMEVSQRAPTAQPRPVAWNAFLRPLGVTIRSDMAYDLLANEVIPLPDRFRPRAAGLSVLHPGAEHPAVAGEPGSQRGGAHLGQHHRHDGRREGYAHAAARQQPGDRHLHQRHHDRADPGLPADEPEPPPARRDGLAPAGRRGRQAARTGGGGGQPRLRHRSLRAHGAGEPGIHAERDRLARAGRSADRDPLEGPAAAATPLREQRDA